MASNNYGAREDIVVHPYNAKYGLLRFDASSVAGQRINRATLRIFLNSLRENGWMHVYAVYSGWNEETVTFANHPPWQTSGSQGRADLTLADVGSLVILGDSIGDG